jgi:CubicO group peptidase (beta-lactamase class C family)
MKYSVLEKKLMEQLKSRITDTTPGVVVRAYQGGRIVCDVSVGDTYAYYDIASLTKVIFTVQAMMVAFEQGKWNLDTYVQEYLPWFPHASVRVQDILTHSSGLVWWMPFYKEIDLSLSLDKRREKLKELISKLEISDAPNSVYSDVGFLVLGFLVEELYKDNLLAVWDGIKDKFYGGTTFEFHDKNIPKHRANLYAPTEECPWRKKLIVGEVHDENCWTLGGVSTHAGLFGSLDDVSWALLNIRSQLLGIARYSVKQKTAKLFASRARPQGMGDWALGYMMPTPGSASCGSHFSLASIGHTGFTGTSMWYDPKADFGVVILSNRVLYGRENKSFAKLRPEIHNWIAEGFRKSAV